MTPRDASGYNPPVAVTIVGIEVLDVRFPTSRTLAGSDAMNEAPDYSAAYVTLETGSALRGYGMTFTIGRGNEIVCAAIRSLAPLVRGVRLEDVIADPRAFWRRGADTGTATGAVSPFGSVICGSCIVTGTSSSSRSVRDDASHRARCTTAAGSSTQ